MVLKLISKKVETGDVKTFYFQPETYISWLPGQFLIYSLPHEHEDTRGRMRFFTISSAPFEAIPTITTRIEKNNPSSFKKILDSLQIGDTIEAKGPDGQFTLDRTDKKYVFIAGGIGITPFMSIIKQLNHENKTININLMYANRNNDILFQNELSEIAKLHKELLINYFISPARIDEDAINKLIADLQTPVFYISGPEPMVSSFEEILKGMGIKQENIKTDYFPGYESI